jgi:transcriptional regulator with XRE-family HTH domain
MPDREITFGQRIAMSRKELGLSLKEVADKVKKEGGQPISPQYLNDIEHDRRQPDSNRLIEQLAAALQLKPEVLYYKAGKLSGAARIGRASDDQIVSAYKAFRKALRSSRK